MICCITLHAKKVFFVLQFQLVVVGWWAQYALNGFYKEEGRFAYIVHFREKTKNDEIENVGRTNGLKGAHFKVPIVIN